MIVRRNVQKEILDNGIIKKTFDLYNDGGCQCFKDCNCYLDRGIVKTNVVTYNNEPTLEIAIEKQIQANKNRERHTLQLSEAQAWKQSLPQKELFKFITQFKSQNKSLKRFNHHEIKDDPEKILCIYFFTKRQISTCT